MPGRDGTGPRGQGSRTGRGLGNCPPTTQSASTAADPQPCGGGYGGGSRRGAGRGRGRW